MDVARTIVVTVLALALLTAAVADWLKWQAPMDSVRKGVCSEPMLHYLGAIKALGAMGVVAGLWVTPLGVAAAIALVLYFLLAMGAHLRVRDWYIWPAVVYLALAAATLMLFGLR